MRRQFQEELRLLLAPPASGGPIGAPLPTPPAADATAASWRAAASGPLPLLLAVGAGRPCWSSAATSAMRWMRAAARRSLPRPAHITACTMSRSRCSESAQGAGGKSEHEHVGVGVGARE